MNQDIKKFEKMIQSDPAIQEKLKAATGQYTGDPADEKALFESVILPVAQEAGLSATFEEFAAYIEDIQKNGANLDETELAQVAGGKGAGLSWLGCCGVGFGAGAGGGSSSGGACVLLGVGWGGSNCVGEGDSVPVDDSWR